jgi:hypothetical protein
VAAAAARAGERLELRRQRPAPTDMSVASLSITYNLLVMAKDSGHYVKAGQQIMHWVPTPDTAIDVTLDGRAIRGVIDQVYTPPGCDEHCIGTLFIREDRN